jgi:hypothetical protein
MGKIRVISTSKIKKITAIKKKRRENGIRAFECGSNPHSKADGFSRSLMFFLAINELIEIKVREIKDAVGRIIVITFSRWLVFEIGSFIYFYIKNVFIIYPINKFLCRGKVILHLRNVNIMLLLQIQNGDCWRSDYLSVV